MFYSSDADAAREFLRDVVEVPATDVGEGWLIFDLPEADIGVHPADESGEEGAPAGTHAISFYCDDVEETVRELEARGVRFTREIEDQGYRPLDFAAVIVVLTAVHFHYAGFLLPIFTGLAVRRLPGTMSALRAADRWARHRPDADRAWRHERVRLRSRRDGGVEPHLSRGRRAR